MSVEFRCKVREASANARALRADARALMRILGLAAYELSVVIVGDGEIRQLNRQFRRKDRPTDVLSFSQLETVTERSGKGDLPPGLRLSDGLPGAGQPLGDVVISVETARRQSKEMGLELQARLRSLLIHGMLHLLGYDHERSRSKAEIMFARERVLAYELDRAGSVEFVPRGRRENESSQLRPAIGDVEHFHQGIVDGLRARQPP